MAQLRVTGVLSTRGACWMLLNAKPSLVYQARNQAITTNENVELTTELDGIELRRLASRSCAMHRGI